MLVIGGRLYVWISFLQRKIDSWLLLGSPVFGIIYPLLHGWFLGIDEKVTDIRLTKGLISIDGIRLEF